MWQVIAEIWREANTPARYDRDPYGALLNQIGHVAVGAFFAAIFCVLWGAATGEMPVRVLVWLGLVAAYLVLIERLAQGWTGRDSVTDAVFVALGAAIPMVSLEEIGAGDRIVLELHVLPALAMLALTLAALAAHVIPRAMRRSKEPDR